MHRSACATKLEVGRTTRMTTVVAIFAGTLILAGCGAPKGPGSGGGTGGAKQVYPGTTQKIHLIWKGSTWKVKLNGGPEEDPKTATISLGKGVGPTMFVVDIQGPTSATFKDPGGLAVWTGSKSQPQSGINSTQILDPIVTDKKKQIVFGDLNQGNAVTLYYGLYFNESGVPSVDPIITNGGS